MWIASIKQLEAFEKGRKKKWTSEMREKCRIVNIGKKLTPEQKSIAVKNLIHNYWEGKERLSMKGDKNPSWKGGTIKESAKIRHSIKYKRWRIAVFERDNYTCQECQQIGGKLNADHIMPFSLYPDLRLLVSNGRTLCIKCHKKTDSYLNPHMRRVG